MTADDMRARLLRMVRREILQVLAPELTSAHAQHVAQALGIVLAKLAGGMSPAASLSDEPARNAAGKLETVFRLGDPTGADDALAEKIRRANAVEAADLFTDAAETEYAQTKAEATALLQAERNEQELLATLEHPVTPELLESYFARVPELRGEQVISLNALPGGFSKETILVRTRSRDVVVRRDLPFGPSDTSAPREFDLLQRLHRHGLKVPRPIAAEWGTAALGLPFLVSERVGGQDASLLAADNPALGRTIALELGRVLGQLHALDPASFGLSMGSATPRQEMSNYLSQWKQWWIRRRIHESAIAEAAFAWLERHVPDDVGRLVIVHGDARPANMLADEEGRLTALLDWEFFHAGDAGEDIEYAREHLAHLVDWPSFLTAYLDAGGVATCESNRRFHAMWWSLRNLVCLEVSWGGFMRGHYPAFRLGAPYFVYRSEVASQLARAMQDARQSQL